MPQLAIDQPGTYAAVLYMSGGPKLEYGSQTGEIARTKAGQPIYQAQVAVTYQPENGRPAASEVITVSVAAEHDPTSQLVPGTPVVFDQLRAGVTSAQVRDDGKGVRGGRLYYSAAAIRAAHARQAKPEAA